VLCHRGLIERQHLPAYLRGHAPGATPGETQAASLAAMERTLIIKTLSQHEGNRALAARTLGINPSTLYRKIKAMKITVPDSDGRGRRRSTSIRAGV